MCDWHLSPEVSESCLSPGMSRYFARGWGEGLPRKPEPKAIWVLHVGTQPGVGTLEAGLQRLGVPPNQQNPGADPPDFFAGAPEYLGPRKVGLSPAQVCHGSAVCLRCCYSSTHWTLKSSLGASHVISLSFTL